MTEKQRPDTAPDASEESARPGPDSTEDSSAEQQASGNGSGGKRKRDGKSRRQGRGATAVAVLALLIALVAGAAVVALGYFGQRRAQSLGERVATAEQAVETNTQDVVLPKISELKSSVEKLGTTVEQRGGALSRLRDNLRQTQSQISDLAELVQGGRRRWQLMDLEDLMLTANQQLQLERDVAGARQALEIVNQRLGKLGDPRLHEIRKKVVDEIAALEALPDPDIEGLTLKLASLSERVGQLPLASDVPTQYTDDSTDDSSGESQGTATASWDHFVTSVRNALDGMLTIRRSDSGSYKPLMAPDDAFFLRQNLRLELQTAKLALLRRNAESYRASLSNARDWLRQFFNTDNPDVSAAIDQLEQMQKVRIGWQAPDITGSLTALRAFLDKTGTSGASSSDGNQASADQNSRDGGE